MANTFELIQSANVGSGGASDITFSVIPGTYTDLVIEFSGRSDRSSDTSDPVFLYFNGVSTNLSSRTVAGDGSGASSSSYTNGRIGIAPSSTATTSTFSNFSIYIPNYTAAVNKSFSVDAVSENNASGVSSAYAVLTAGLWSSTAAITSVKLLPQVGPNFVQYSTAYLYGVKNA